MSDRSRYTLVDFFYDVISPVLIMALVVSLVFFLIDVFYDGAYPGTVQWIFFFFVFGSVLVSRIAMNGEIARRAAGYGIVLGLASFLALWRFVDYADTPLQGLSLLVNFGLLGLVWWSAYQLTWDCTFLHDQRVNQGLLDASKEPEAPAQPTEAPREKRKKKKRPATKIEPSPLYLWWQRYCKHRDASNKKRTPGTWVIYFSLAALPLFGLGQARIPLEESGRRQYAFWLMVCYAASALGLLVATQFLGLRRYLRDRGIKMPGSIIARWLTLAAVLIVAVLVISAVVPRPWPEYSLANLTGAGSDEREGGSRPGGEGKEGDNGQQQRDNSASQRGNDGQGSGGSGSRGSGSQGESPGSGSKGSASGSSSGISSGSGRGSSGNRSRSTGSKSLPKTPQVSNPPWLQSLGPLGTVLKWIVIVGVVLVVAFFVLRSGLTFLANFTGWAARLLAALTAWWNRLFGQKPRSKVEVVADVPPPPRLLRPFSAFTNPFLDGAVDGMSPEGLVQYTFDALQAWAADHGVGRHGDETPLEFTSRLGEEQPAMRDALRALAEVYGRMAYANQRVTDAVRPALRALWSQMDKAGLVAA